jgi:hypothetical protein
MDRQLAPPISGSWSPGVARAVDGASHLHGPLRVDRNAETEKKLNGWTKGWGTKRQGTVLALLALTFRFESLVLVGQSLISIFSSFHGLQP